MGVCVSKCSSKQPVFKTIINDSFSILALKNNPKKAFLDPKFKRIQNLQAHVKNHTKTLIDHIESNRDKLVETIVYIKKTIFTNNNIEYHLVGVFILLEIVTNLNKFKIKTLKNDNENEEGIGTLKLRDYSISLDHVDGDPAFYTIDENLSYFEREFFDLMLFFFENKYKYRDIMFNYSLGVLLAYSQISNDRINSDKNAQVLKKIINDENIRQKLIDKKITKNDYKIIIDIIRILLHLTIRSNQNVTMEILQDYLMIIMHTFTCLDKIAEFEEVNLIEKDETKNITLKSLLFESLDHLCQVTFQINEFGMIINPLFEFFDEISWSFEELHLGIFMKIIENSRKSKNLEHFEIFLIEKIIDYLTTIEKNKNLINKLNSFHSNPLENKNMILPSKNLNQKKEIKEKVYYLLKKVINHISYIYLSFLYIDKLVSFFCQTIEDTNLEDPTNSKLKKTFYKTFKKFLLKIYPFIKNIFQFMNGISYEIYKRITSSNPNNNSIKEIFKLFYMTLEQIEKFPVYSSIPDEIVRNLLKGSEKNEFLIESYKALNMIFSAKFSNQEVSQVSDNFSPQIEMIAFESSVNGNNNCDTLLHLPYNIFIIVLVDMWKNLKEFKNGFNAKSEITKEDIINFLSFYNYMRGIIFSMQFRNDSAYTSGLNSFYAELLTIVSDEKNIAFNALLFYILYDQIFIYSKVTNDEVLCKYISQIKEQIQSEAINKLVEFVETLGENTILNTTDINLLTEKLMNISIKNKRNFIFESNSLLKAFKEMINQQNSPDANQEVPKFDDFIKINENSNQEKFFKDIVTIGNVEIQDFMSENEKGSSHNLNSLVILNPKPLSPLNDMQNNNNFENALQTVKANNLRKKKLEALIEIDIKS